MEFLKKFFEKFKKNKKQSNVVEVISLPDLEYWIEDQIKVILDDEHIKEQFELYLNIVKDKRWMLEVNNQEILQKLSISKHQSELRNVASSLQKLTLSFPENQPLEKVLKHSRDLKIATKSSIYLVEETLLLFKNLSEENHFYLLMEAILKELRELKLSIEQFDEKISKSGFSSIEALILRAKSLQNLIEKHKKYKAGISDLEKRVEASELKKEEKNRELKEIEEKPGYKNFLSSKDRRKELVQQLNEEKEKIISFFESFSFALERYKDYNSSILISSYLDNSLQAFEKDEGLSILHHFQHLKALLTNGKMPLPLEKIEEVVNLIENNSLRSIQLNYFSLSRELKEDANYPDDSSFLAKYEEVKYRKSHFENQSNRLSDEFIKMGEDLEELQESLRGEINFLQNLAKVSLNKKIRVEI